MVWSATAEQETPVAPSNDVLQAMVRTHTEGALIQEITDLEQAQARAQSGSAAELELRPGVSKTDADLSLRIYLPDRWSKTKLRNQLLLVKEAGTLRVEALEWTELMMVYRNFCTYRMLQKQIELYDQELALIAPYLAQANLGVQQHQLAVLDRAKLFGGYLALANDRDKANIARLEIIQDLYGLLGHDADLDALSREAFVEMPTQLDIEQLIQHALENRRDYRQLDVEAQSYHAATAVARSEDGFRFKYIEPGYNVDHETGDEAWNISAAFSLWGTRNPDVSVYQQQQLLALSTMHWRRKQIENRLRTLLKTTEAYHEQAVLRKDQVNPLVAQLQQDAEFLKNVPMSQLRDYLLVREHVLAAGLQESKVLCTRELLAVDLAEELGSLAP